MAKELGLGVLFYGKIDKSFSSAISSLEKQVSGLNRRFATFNKGIAALSNTTKTAAKEHANFANAQEWINKTFAKGSIANKEYSSTLKKVESAFTKQSAKIKDAGGDYRTFISSADRLTATQKIMAGELKISGSGFKAAGFAAQNAAQKTAIYGKDLSSTLKTTKQASSATRESTSQLSEHAKFLGKTSEYTSRYRQAAAQLFTTYGTGDSTVKKIASSLERVDKAIFGQSQTMKSSAASRKKFYESANRIALLEREAAGAIKLTSRGIERVKTVTTAATRARTSATNATRRASDEMGMYGRRIASVQGGIQRLSAALKVTASYGVASAAIYSVINAFKQGIDTIFAFDQALKNLQAITSATDAEIIVLEEVIKNVASTTKYSVQEVSEAAILLGQAGFTASESLDAINSVAMLATGTLSSMTSAADLMTTAVRVFGLEAKDTSQISDVFASAVNRSKLTIDKLRTSFNYIGPIASKAGLTIEETAAGMMVLANSGLRASTIGTGFRQVLSRLIAPSDKLRTAFIAAGADLTKLNPAMSSMEEIIEELTKVVPNAQKAFELFGLRGASAVAAFTRAGAEGFKKMLIEVYRVGTASSMADKQMEGLAAMSKNLTDKIGLLAIAIGEGGIASAFRLLLKTTRPVVDLMIDLADSIIGRIIVATTSLTAVTLTLGAAFKYALVQLSALSFGYSVSVTKSMMAAQGAGVLRVAIAALSKAFKSLWALMIKNPYVAVAAAATLVVIGIATWLDKLSNLTKEIEANNIKTDKHVQSLEYYKQKLSETTEGSIKYSATLQRLLKEYPKLAKSVDLTTMKFKDEGKALDALIAKKHDEKIKGLVELYDEYGKKINRTIAFNEAWVVSVGAVKKILEDLYEVINYVLPGIGTAAKIVGWVWETTSEAVGTSINYLIEKLVEGGEKTKEVEALIVQQASAFKTLAAELKQYGTVAGSTVEDISKVLSLHTDKSEEEISSLSKKLKQYLDDSAQSAVTNSNILVQLSDGWAEVYAKAGESRKQDVLDAWEKYREKAAILLKEAVKYAEMTGDKEAADKKYAFESERLLKEEIERIAASVDVRINLKRTTAERELEIVDYLITKTNEKHNKALVGLYLLEAEKISASEGTAEELTAIAEEFSEKRALIEKESLDESIALNERKLSVSKTVFKDRLEAVEDYYDSVKDVAEQSHNNIVDLLDERLRRELNKINLQNLSEQGIFDAKEKAQSKYYKDLGKESDRHYQELSKTVNETYDAIAVKIKTSGESAEKREKDIFKAKKNRNDELKKLYQERVDTYKKTIDFLISEEERLTGAIKSSQDERKQIEETTADTIRSLKQNLMTDEQKWNDDRAEADRLYAKGVDELYKGNYESAKDYFTKSQDAAAGLAKEVKDGEKVISTEAENTVTAIGLVEKAGEAAAGAQEKHYDALYGSLAKVRSNLNVVKDELDKYVAKVDEARKKELNLDVKPALDAIAKVVTALEKFKAANYDKTVTVKFKASASPVRPFSETIANVRAKITDLNDYIESLDPEITTDFSSVTASLGEYQKTLEAYESQLDDLAAKEKDLANQIEGSVKSRLSIEQATNDLIYNLKYDLMTNEEQWLADKQKAEDLYHKGVQASTQGDTDSAIAYYSEAQKIATSLARDVKEGEVVVSTASESTAVAIGLVEKAGDAAADAERERLKGLEDSAKETGSRINGFTDKIEILFEEISKTIIETTKKVDSYTQAVENVGSAWEEMSDTATSSLPGIDQAIDKYTQKAVNFIARMVDAQQEYDRAQSDSFLMHSGFHGEIMQALRKRIEMTRNLTAKAMKDLKLHKSALEDFWDSFKDPMTVITEFKGKASPIKPLMETIQNVKGSLKGLYDYVSNLSTEFLINFTGKGSSKTGLIKKVEEVSKKIEVLERRLENEHSFDISFEESNKELEKYKTQLNDLQSKLNSQTFEKAEKSLEEYTSILSVYESQLDTLIDREKELSSQIEKAVFRKLDLEENTANLIYNLKYKLMTDEEQWLADKKKAEELYAQGQEHAAKGQTEQASEYFKEAQSIYASLARDVKRGDEIIATASENTAIAIDLIKKTGVVAAQAEEKAIKQLEENVKTTQKQIEKTSTVIKVVVQSMDTLFGKLAENMKNATNDMVSSIQQMAEKINTIKSGISTKYDIKMQAGGKVPGSGSGDTVPALLEPGEFIEPKSTVKEYGLNFFEALRNKIIPKERIKSLIAGVKMRTGGSVGVSRPQVQKMQTGGRVKPDTGGTLFTINFNVNRQSHKLYGEEDAINSLVKNLRRSQLVTV